MPGFLQVPYILIKLHRVLMMAAVVDVRRRYAGTVFGLVWVVFYPVAFLTIYMFVYLVILRVKLPDFSSIEYVLYIFSGLVPYISLMESMSQGASCIRQNMNLVTNSILPLDLLPARCVVTAYIGQAVGIIFLIVLAAISDNLSWKLLSLPVAMLIFSLFLLGLAYFISILGVILPDLNQMVGLFLVLLMFLSPIAFQPGMVPDSLSFMIFLNPVYYMLEPFRWAVFPDYDMVVGYHFMPMVIGLCIFIAGCHIFIKFRDRIIDNV